MKHPLSHSANLLQPPIESKTRSGHSVAKLKQVLEGGRPSGSGIEDHYSVLRADFFGLRRGAKELIPVAAVPAFNGFLLYFAVPALLFRFASTAAFAEIMNGRFFIAYTVGGLVTLFLVVAFARGVMGARLRDASFYGLAASATNIGYLAIPLLVALLGASAALRQCWRRFAK